MLIEMHAYNMYNCTDATYYKDPIDVYISKCYHMDLYVCVIVF